MAELSPEARRAADRLKWLRDAMYASYAMRPERCLYHAWAFIEEEQELDVAWEFEDGKAPYRAKGKLLVEGAVSRALNAFPRLAGHWRCRHLSDSVASWRSWKLAKGGKVVDSQVNRVVVAFFGRQDLAGDATSSDGSFDAFGSQSAELFHESVLLLRHAGMVESRLSRQGWLEICYVLAWKRPELTPYRIIHAFGRNSGYPADEELSRSKCKIHPEPLIACLSYSTGPIKDFATYLAWQWGEISFGPGIYMAGIDQDIRLASAAAVDALLEVVAQRDQRAISRPGQWVVCSQADVARVLGRSPHTTKLLEKLANEKVIECGGTVGKRKRKIRFLDAETHEELKRQVEKRRTS